MQLWRRQLIAAVLLIALTLHGVAAAVTPAAAGDSASIDRLLDEADQGRLSRHGVLVDRLAILKGQQGDFSAAQAERYRFLEGWHKTYAGDFDGAVALLGPLAREATDPVLRFRAKATMVNALSIARRYEEAFTLQAELTEQLPVITDAEARAQALGVTSQLLFQVGEYDESRRYADQLMREQPIGWAGCGAAWLLFESARRQGVPAGAGLAIDDWIDRCGDDSQGYFSAGLELIKASMLTDASQPVKALDVLDRIEPIVLSSAYPRQVLDLQAARASAALALERLDVARSAAQVVVDRSGPEDVSEPLIEAHRVLYEVSKARGQMGIALEHHERYLEIQRAVLDDAKARTLAFQMAKHRATAARLEIEALNRRNDVLALEARLASSNANIARLWLALLALLIASILFWAWRLVRTQARLRHQAETDFLTGVHNRQHFLRQAEESVRSCARDRRPVGFVLLDLDHFKMINDVMGHAAGDEALVRAAMACRAALAPGVLYGRLGGEEFGILLPGAVHSEAAAMAERVRAALDRPPVDEHAPRVTASLGVATSASAGYDLRTLLLHADAALYQAKHAGRNRVALYDDALGEAVRLARAASKPAPGSREQGSRLAAGN
jgi:diguanylate cyclase (GGDEF)-like protein